MIPITKQIIGPGIEEEYEDALQRINGLLQLLESFPFDDGTPEGRLKHELTWLKQEILDGHISLPIDERFIATLLYVMTEDSLGHLDGLQNLATELSTILTDGLVKPRHYPVVAAMIDDAIELLAGAVPTPELRAAIDGLQMIRKALFSGTLQLPLPQEDWPALTRIRWTKQPGITSPAVQDMFALTSTLFSGTRPIACSKGPLPAPHPGLRQDPSSGTPF